MVPLEPHIAELLLCHRSATERRGGRSARRAKAGSSWSVLVTYTWIFLPKLIPSLIRLGSNLVKNYEMHGGGR